MLCAQQCGRSGPKPGHNDELHMEKQVEKKTILQELTSLIRSDLKNVGGKNMQTFSEHVDEKKRAYETGSLDQFQFIENVRAELDQLNHMWRSCGEGWAEIEKLLIKLEEKCEEMGVGAGSIPESSPAIICEKLHRVDIEWVLRRQDKPELCTVPLTESNVEFIIDALKELGLDVIRDETPADILDTIKDDEWAYYKGYQLMDVKPDLNIKKCLDLAAEDLKRCTPRNYSGNVLFKGLRSRDLEARAQEYMRSYDKRRREKALGDFQAQKPDRTHILDTIENNEWIVTQGRCAPPGVRPNIRSCLDAERVSMEWEIDSKNAVEVTFTGPRGYQLAEAARNYREDQTSWPIKK